jgi:hypothetical protein
MDGVATPRRNISSWGFAGDVGGNGVGLVLVLALLLVLILFGAGFAVHLLWIAAVIFALTWLVGFALGRGEGAGRHRFYRW